MDVILLFWGYCSLLDSAELFNQNTYEVTSDDEGSFQMRPAFRSYKETVSTALSIVPCREN